MLWASFALVVNQRLSIPSPPPPWTEFVSSWSWMQNSAKNDRYYALSVSYWGVCYVFIKDSLSLKVVASFQSKNNCIYKLPKSGPVGIKIVGTINDIDTKLLFYNSTNHLYSISFFPKKQDISTSNVSIWTTSVWEHKKILLLCTYYTTFLWRLFKVYSSIHIFNTSWCYGLA